MSSSLPELSLTSTPATRRGLEEDIRQFWSSFPCPPPWKPRLLTEVNSTRLDPRVSKNVQTFLAGKCDIRYVLSDGDYSLQPGDLRPGHDLGLTYAPDPGSPFGDPVTSNHQWCDTTCQLSLGCAIFLVVVAMMVAVVICASRQRVRHKMVATRPSRQQLHLSTSTSDAVNCTEFSNLEIHGDDDFVYPPFRHRGLPHPPTPCDPSCNQKWTCPNCSSCHPLIRLSPPPDLYYSRAYSAVYETIDDEDDCSAERTEHRASNYQGAVTTTIPEPKSPVNYFPYHINSNSGISTVQLRPRPRDDDTANKLMAETMFNGMDNPDCVANSLPNYFELENNCAFSSIHDPPAYHPGFNSSGVRSTSNDCCSQGVTETGNVTHPHPSYQHFLDNLHHSREHCQGQRDSFSRAAEECFSNNQSLKLSILNFGETQNDAMRPTATHDTRYSSRPSESMSFNRWNNYCHCDSSEANRDLKQVGNDRATSSVFNTSNFLTDLTDHGFCPIYQPGDQSLLISQRGLPSPQQITTVNADPDLIRDASCHSRRVDQPEVTSSPSNDADNDNNEAPSRKAVLALHSRYFAKTSAA